MLRALRLILALGGQRAGTLGGHAKARATHLALLAAFGAAAAVFALVLVTAALARQLGLLAALAIMAGVFAVACVGVLLAMRAEARAHRAALAQQAVAERRALQAALLTAVPRLRRGGLLAAGLGVVALLLTLRRDRDDPRD